MSLSVLKLVLGMRNCGETNEMYAVTVSLVLSAECREADDTATAAGQGVLLEASVRPPEPPDALGRPTHSGHREPGANETGAGRVVRQVHRLQVGTDRCLHTEE